MFLQLFSLPITRNVFIAGFVINGIIVWIRAFPFFNIILVAIVGGFVFCGIWAGIINILIFLLTEQELIYFFNLPTVTNEQDDIDGDLTLDELYNGNNDNDGEGFTIDDVDVNLDDDDDLDLDNLDLSDSAESLGENLEKKTKENIDKVDGELGYHPNGGVTEAFLQDPNQFYLTVKGKTLTAHPQDGAKAIKKVLHDDHQKNKK